MRIKSTLTSPIITLTIGREQRLFAAHEDVLCLSPFFAAACRGKFLEAHAKRSAQTHSGSLFQPVCADLHSQLICLMKIPKFSRLSSNTSTRATIIHGCSTTNVEILGSLRILKLHNTLIMAMGLLDLLSITRMWA